MKNFVDGWQFAVGRFSGFYTFRRFKEVGAVLHYTETPHQPLKFESRDEQLGIRD